MDSATVLPLMSLTSLPRTPRTLQGHRRHKAFVIHFIARSAIKHCVTDGDTTAAARYCAHNSFQAAADDERPIMGLLRRTVPLSLRDDQSCAVQRQIERTRMRAAGALARVRSNAKLDSADREGLIAFDGEPFMGDSARRHE
jgi:hypothetical protein